MGRPKASCPCRRITPHNYGTRYKIVSSLRPVNTLQRATQSSLPSMDFQVTRHTNDNLADDYTSFSRINSILLNPPTPLKHIPLRIYIPSSPSSSNPSNDTGSIKIIQTLIPPLTERREIQTLGSALNTLLPSLFPSRRDAILAEPILHGAPVPFRAPLEEVMREAAYADGWVHLSLRMM